MEDKWNERWLKPPPVCLLAKNRDQLKDGFMNGIMVPLSAILSALSTESTLSSEKSVLQRVVYKLNNQQRREKAFKGLGMIMKCLQRYLDMNLKKMIESFATDLDRIQETEDKIIYLPSLQSVQYYLSRMMGGAGLLAQTTDYCRHIYTPITEQMALGHFLDKNLLYLGLIGRIWVLCRYLVGQIQSCYCQIYNLVDIFPAAQVPWLKSNEELPGNIQVWLNSRWPLFYHQDQRTYQKLKQWDKQESPHEMTVSETAHASDESEENIRKSGQNSDYGLLDTTGAFGIEDDIGIPLAESTLISLEENSSILFIDKGPSPLEDQSNMEESSCTTMERYNSVTLEESTDNASFVPSMPNTSVPLETSTSILLNESSSIALEDKNLEPLEKTCQFPMGASEISVAAKKSRRMCVKLDFEKLGIEVKKCKSPRRLLKVMKFIHLVIQLMWRKSRQRFGYLLEKHTQFITDFMNKQWDGSPMAQNGLQWCKKRVLRKIVKGIQEHERSAFQRGIVFPDSLPSIGLLIERFVNSREGITRLLDSIRFQDRMVLGSCSIFLPSTLSKELLKNCELSSVTDHTEGDKSNAKFLAEIADFKRRVLEAMKESLPRKYDDSFIDINKPRRQRRKKKSSLKTSELNLQATQTSSEMQGSGNNGEHICESSVSIVTQPEGDVSKRRRRWRRKKSSLNASESSVSIVTQPKDDNQKLAKKQESKNSNELKRKSKRKKRRQKGLELLPVKCMKVESGETSVENFSSPALLTLHEHGDLNKQSVSHFPKHAKKNKKTRMNRKKNRENRKLQNK